MSYLLFIAASYIIMLASAKSGISISSTAWICLAILTAGEVVAWSWRKK